MLNSSAGYDPPMDKLPVNKALPLKKLRTSHHIAKLAMLALGCSAMCGLCDEQDKQSKIKALGTALKKSQAMESVLFKKSTSWLPGLRIVAINGHSEAGIFVAPHLRYLKEDQIKLVRQQHWVDGICYTQENLMATQGAWKSSPVGKMPVKRVSYPFQLNDAKSITIKQLPKEGNFDCYRVIPSKAQQTTIVNDILGGKPVLAAERAIDLKDSTVVWTIVIDPEHQLIRRIDQKLMTKMPGSVVRDTSIKNLTLKDIYQLKHKGSKFSHRIPGASHLVTTQFTYPEKILIELPDGLKKILKRMKEAK